jgi:hypothetical protein
MFVTKIEERREARRLRSEGWSVRRIARELGVAVSSVSVWVRDIERPPPANETPPPAPPERIVEGSRICGRCHEELPLSSFNLHPKGRQWWCRECFRQYFRDRGRLHRQQSEAARVRRRVKARSFVGEYLQSRACVDCGEPDVAALEFDHVGERREYISRLMHDGAAVAAIRKELEACEVVCVNCHRRRTGRRAGWRRVAERWWRTPRPHRGARNIAFVYSILELGRCVDCGLHDVCVLDFDHVSGKTASVMRLAYDEASLERLRDEVARCELRCANCHRRRTLRDAGITRCAN